MSRSRPNGSARLKTKFEEVNSDLLFGNSAEGSIHGIKFLDITHLIINPTKQFRHKIVRVHHMPSFCYSVLPGFFDHSKIEHSLTGGQLKTSTKG